MPPNQSDHIPLSPNGIWTATSRKGTVQLGYSGCFLKYLGSVPYASSILVVALLCAIRVLFKMGRNPGHGNARKQRLAASAKESMAHLTK
jgi:hypothetical protein